VKAASLRAATLRPARSRARSRAAGPRAAGPRAARSRAAGPRAARGTRTRALTAAAALGATLLALTACSGGGSQAKAAGLSSVGKGEGTLRLLGPPGFLQDGSTDPRADWVLSFEERTGCSVAYTQVANESSIPAALQLHGARFYDGVVAPPAVASGLISAGQVAPLDVRLVDGYASISRALRAQPAVQSGGKTYGIPYLWSSYVLGYVPSSVSPAPLTWSVLFDPASAAEHAGKIMLPDTPLTIALAAVYLKTTRPSLGIADPFELNGAQFAAAISLLKSVRPSITKYESSDPQVITDLASGGAVLGAVLPRHVDLLARAGRKIASTAPAQGTTGATEFWLMNAQASHPNCMYEWLTWSLTPRVQQQAAAWTGTAPVNPAACDGLGRQFCGIYHVADAAYLGKVAFAHVPGPGCGNGKQDCVGWAQWQSGWDSIVG
jgi:putative spermidine/putrescine transport system substrate-binding protein